MKWARYFLLAGWMVFALAGCKDNDYKGEPHLIVTLTDASSDQFVSLVTSVKQVGLFDGSQWLLRDIDILPFDIMLYTGYDYITLLDEKIPEGHYSKLKIVFGDDNQLVIAGESSGRELVSDPLDLVWECDIDYQAVSDRVDVGSVDLDINRAVTYNQSTDSYSYSPCDGCRLMDAQTEGAVSATVVDYAENVITSVVQVQFCQQDSVLRSTYCNTQDGKLFYRLSEGIYDIRFIPQSPNYMETELDSVVVNNAEATSLGAIVLLNYED